MNKKIYVFVIVCSLCQFSLSAQTLNLDSLISQKMQQTHTPGLSAFILKKGIPVWAHNYGTARIDEKKKVDDSTIFMLASVSKTIVSVAAMKAWEQGYFQLDNDISRYLGFKVRNPNFPDDSITMRQLLTHTSSLRDNWNVLNAAYVKGDNPIPLRGFLANYFLEGGKYYNAKQNFFNYAPATQWNYCNVAVTLAAYVVEATSGVPFDTFCIKNIFEPLCMDNASWHLAGLNTNQIAMPYEWQNGAYVPQGYYGYPDYADGEMRITAKSLARFLGMILNHGSFNQQKILDSSTVAMLFTPQIPGIDTTQGIIWYEFKIGDRLCWGHNGGDLGVSTNMYFFAPDTTGIILLSNGGNFYPNDIMDDLFDFAKTLEPAAGSNFNCDAESSTAEKIYTNDQSTTAQVYPNPAHDQLQIQFNSQEEHSVTIIDVYGSVQLEKNFAGNDLQIPLYRFANGIYFVEIRSENRKEVIPFIKN